MGERQLANEESDLWGGGQSMAFSLISSLPRDPPTCPQSPPREKTELINSWTQELRKTQTV